jgi:hypothetical protein
MSLIGSEVCLFELYMYVPLYASVGWVDQITATSFFCSLRCVIRGSRDASRLAVDGCACQPSKLAETLEETRKYMGHVSV